MHGVPAVVRRGHRQVLRLVLIGTPVTGAGIEALAGTRLETLDLTGTGVDDAAVAKLASIPSLRVVYLSDTKVTKAGVDALLKALPDAKVVH